MGVFAVVDDALLGVEDRNPSLFNAWISRPNIVIIDNMTMIK